jgi:hypothetical protein
VTQVFKSEYLLIERNGNYHEERFARCEERPSERQANTDTSGRLGSASSADEGGLFFKELLHGTRAPL